MDLLTAAAALAQAPDAQLAIDHLEAEMLATGAAVELPVTHRFTPDLYLREIFMPAGTLLTSKIHRTRHPYMVLSGRARVWIEGVGVQELEAGHAGITEPGTRRVLYIVEDCRWVTFHQIGEGETGDVEAIEARIIERRELPDGRNAHEEYQAQLRALTAGILPAQAEYGGAP